MKAKILLAALVAAPALALVSLSLSAPAPPPPSPWKVIAWNDLGMHCMDSDYSVFSILPPYNTVQAQIVMPGGHLLVNPAGITLTYEAVTDPGGSINTSSAGKTNFWSFARLLYGGSSTPNTGLAGNDMPGPANTPQPMTWDASHHLFEAVGVPLTPYDDDGHRRHYPLMRLVARDATGAILASTDVVLPISDEMDCRLCHGSNAGPAARPSAGWVHDADAERDYRLNILRLHDEFRSGNPSYAGLLTQAGYRASGLYDTVVSAGVPILCARCHASNALPGTGLGGLPPLTEALHARHASVYDPISGQTLGASSNRAACYRCHPGAETRCLRGAMGSAVGAGGDRAIQCQSCHGDMDAVGASGREGWLEEPTCQSCHTGTAVQNSGQIRYTSVFTTAGQVRQAANQTFATTPNTPSQGFSLYRFSTGHGDLRCESCHGATHAIYPSAHPNDNLQNLTLQGHVGTLADCDACHDQQPVTVTGGPHGMHPIGRDWLDRHDDAAEHGRYPQCRLCHGTSYSGSVLSLSQGDRMISTQWGTKHFWKGFRIGCYACHQGPTNDHRNPNRPAVVSNATASTVDTPVAIPLSATDPDSNPLQLRVISQPAHGRVALNARVATYYPEPGFAGTDSFTFAAWDGQIDSNLGTVSVDRGATWDSFGSGYPGTGGTIPTLLASAPPILGTTLQAAIQNSSGQATTILIFSSTERSARPSGLGGVFLTEPTIDVTLAMPAQGIQLPWPIPNDAGLIGASIYTQVLQVDAGARFMVSFTPGLRMTLGR